MRGFFIILLLLAIIFSTADAQPNSPNKWRVGRFGEIDFTSTYGMPLMSQDTAGTVDCNVSAWDNTGNMIIYSNGFNVFDANIDLMPGGPLVYDSTYLNFPTIYGSELSNGAVIVSRPDYFNQFYFFHTSMQGPDSANIIYGELYYSIIDVNLNGGLGAITSIKNVLIDDSTWIGHLSAVRHGNGRDWWLVSGRNYSNVINTWLVQSDTIIGPFSQSAGLSVSWPDPLNQTQFSPDGNKLAIAYAEHIGQTKSFILADFDRCSGQILNPLIVQFSDNDQTAWGVTGIEFSSSGRFLYASSGSYLYQFDLWNTNIQNSKVLVKTHDHVFAPLLTGFYHFKRGPDERIYMATASGNYVIDVINYPDSFGVACDVQLRQINYYTQFSSSGLGITVMPNYPDYALGPLVGSPCDTLSGLDEYTDISEPLSIYPNPSNGNFTISYNGGKQNKVKFELLDICGKVVYSMQLAKGSSKEQISLPERIASGIYVGRVVSEKGVLGGKVVLQR